MVSVDWNVDTLGGPCLFREARLVHKAVVKTDSTDVYTVLLVENVPEQQVDVARCTKPGAQSAPSPATLHTS